MITIHTFCRVFMHSNFIHLLDGKRCTSPTIKMKRFKNAKVSLTRFEMERDYFTLWPKEVGGIACNNLDTIFPFLVSMPEGSRCDFNKGVCGWRVPSQIPTKSG